jgi:hypothetical protein
MISVMKSAITDSVPLTWECVESVQLDASLKNSWIKNVRRLVLVIQKLAFLTTVNAMLVNLDADFLMFRSKNAKMKNVGMRNARNWKITHVSPVVLHYVLSIFSEMEFVTHSATTKNATTTQVIASAHQGVTKKS